MADVPDIYADRVGVAIGPFGVTVTLQLTMPALTDGPQEPEQVIVARVRMSATLAQVLAQGLNEAIAAQAHLQQQADSKVQH